MYIDYIIFKKVEPPHILSTKPLRYNIKILLRINIAVTSRGQLCLPIIRMALFINVLRQNGCIINIQSV